MRTLTHEFAGTCHFIFSGGRWKAEAVIPSLLKASFKFLILNDNITKSGLYKLIVSTLGSYAEIFVLGASGGKFDRLSTAIT